MTDSDDTPGGRPTAPHTPPAPPLRPEPGRGRFDGSIALVVGGGTGIGEATAHRLAAEGAQLIVADLDAQAARAVAEALRPVDGASREAIGLDATDTAAVDAALAGIEDRHGRLDVLVHVAGGNVDHGGPEETDDDVWRRLLDLNLMGPMRTARAAARRLRRSERGAVVMVGSVNAMLALGGEPYSAAKAALQSLTQNLASALAPDGVRVNAVAPGTVRTAVWGEEGPDHLAPWYPLGRVGEPADIGAAIAFLASGDAAWITGQVLPVEGGLLLRGPGPA